MLMPNACSDVASDEVSTIHVNLSLRLQLLTSATNLSNKSSLGSHTYGSPLSDRAQYYLMMASNSESMISWYLAIIGNNSRLAGYNSWSMTGEYGWCCSAIGDGQYWITTRYIDTLVHWYILAHLYTIQYDTHLHTYTLGCLGGSWPTGIRLFSVTHEHSYIFR